MYTLVPVLLPEDVSKDQGPAIWPDAEEQHWSNRQCKPVNYVQFEKEAHSLRNFTPTYSIPYQLSICSIGPRVVCLQIPDQVSAHRYPMLTASPGIAEVHSATWCIQ